jgi:hypothetical protein
MEKRAYKLRIGDFRPGIKSLRKYVERCKAEIFQIEDVWERRKVTAYAEIGCSLIAMYNLALSSAVLFPALKGLEILANK